MSSVNFTNFGKALLVRGYIMIFSMVLGLFYSLRPFLSYIIPIYGTLDIIWDYASTAFAIISLVISLIILIYTNRLTKIDNHPHLRKFYSYTLIVFILQIFFLLSPIIQYLFLRLIPSSSFFQFTLIIMIVSGIFGLIGAILAVIAWSIFSSYSTTRQFNINVTKGSNFIKIGYVILIFSTIITMGGSIFNATIFYLGLPYTLFNIIFTYAITIFAILFNLIIPILLIIGHLRVGKSIQSVSVSSSDEPTLGPPPTLAPEPKYQQPKDHVCPNCGSKLPLNTPYCPFCGSSTK